MIIFQVLQPLQLYSDIIEEEEQQRNKQAGKFQFIDI